MKRDNNLNWD